ncbi:MAG: aminopeptidase P family N-terminal domain-containing protein [Proteobacteria bacterium]|nr:aminopeptidase P family N-terminal domain-containing protein [Pseudomonadota bacterium]MDA1181442.1 aminopeptidase P family N-terminal domain-containing protein [Pseudomonadota bacterium]
MIFSKAEYLSRLAKVKKSMDQKNMDILILTDPSNMNYLTGYDGWS